MDWCFFDGCDFGVDYGFLCGGFFGWGFVVYQLDW